jgi:peptidoglycan-N-acetylglucosamine deacetylase
MPPRGRGRTGASAGHHRSVAFGAGLALGVAASHALPALAPLVPGLADGLGIRRRLGRTDAVAITFDDGPHPQGTEAVLEVLEREDAVATFFLVGEQVRRNPGLAAEIAAAGHAVQLHGERHRNQLRLTGGQIRDDLRRGEESIREATRAAPRLYRPPYGIFSALGLRIVRRSPWEPMLWSRWGRDWSGRASADSVATLATRDLHGGEVVLLHDADHYSDPGCWRATAEALPRIIEAIRERQKKTVALQG